MADRPVSTPELPKRYRTLAGEVHAARESADVMVSAQAVIVDDLCERMSADGVAERTGITSADVDAMVREARRG